MAAKTLVDTFKVLRDSPQWLNSLELAFEADRGERACREAARQLIKIGVVQLKLVDTRHYFLMCTLSNKQERIPLIIDINETIKIKDAQKCKRR